MKVVIILLIVCTLGLGALLYVRHNSAVKEVTEKNTTIITLSNNLARTKQESEEREQVNLRLNKDLDQRRNDLANATNNLVKINNELQETMKRAAAEKEAAQAAAKAAKDELERKENRIAELETQKTQLDKKADDMQTALANLAKTIEATEQKLAASEGDRDFLLKELKRLQKEKAELERQFNDLAALRTQVAKLKDELSISRRLEWIRMGIYGGDSQKGAEKLLTGLTPAPQNTNNFNLNVELKQDGSVVVKTNALAVPNK